MLNYQSGHVTAFQADSSIFVLILLSQKNTTLHYINMLSLCILPLCLVLNHMIWCNFGEFWAIFGTFCLFIRYPDLYKTFFKKHPHCICKVKRVIFIINCHLSGNIMWPVQMWISRHTCHLSFFAFCAALHWGKVCITKFLIILRKRWVACGESWKLALELAFVSIMLLAWIRINKWLDQSRMFYSQPAVDSHSVCRDPDSVLRVQGGCTRWPTGCLSSTCKPTSVALSSLSETYSGTAAEAFTVHEHVQTWYTEVPPKSYGTHLLRNLPSKFMRGQINNSFISYLSFEKIFALYKLWFNKNHHQVPVRSLADLCP